MFIKILNSPASGSVRHLNTDYIESFQTEGGVSTITMRRNGSFAVSAETIQKLWEFTLRYHGDNRQKPQYDDMLEIDDAATAK